MPLIPFPNSALECGNFVSGTWQCGSGALRQVISPYNNQVVGFFKESLPGDLELAIAGASQAFPEWRAQPLKERCQTLFRWRELLLKDQELISQTVAMECGKTVAEAQAGLMKGIEVLEFATAVQNLDRGGQMEVSRGVHCHYQRQPLGVVAGITPFNFPAMVPLWMIPIALVAGNTFVWKPSDKTPLTSLHLANTLNQAGLPAGALSVVQGGRETVKALVEHDHIQAVGFVGSTPVARSIYHLASRQSKRVLALGGAKNHILLMPDADPQVVGQGITDSCTGCAGQRCMAASVLLVVRDCEYLVQEIVQASQQKQLGTQMGAIISQESNQHLRTAIAEAEQQGCRLLVDGRQCSPPPGYEKGNWLGPSILDLVRPDSPAACEELFGPVLSIIRVDTLSEALRIENKSPYGNAASVFTQDGGVAQQVCRQARAGMVGVNIGVPVPREPFSFGGIQDSRFGHGDITGVSALDFWSDRKKITAKWGLQNDRNWMS